MIPAKNEEKTIAKCLDSLVASDYPKEKMDIMVVVDGSTDRTIEIAKRYSPLVRVIEHEPQTCKAAALNKSFHLAEGDVIGIYDSDCIVEPDCISHIAKRFEDPKIAGVGGTLASHNNKSFLTKAMSLETTLISFVQHLISRSGRSPMFLGKNMFIRKNILLEAGGLDEFTFSEDTSLSISLWKKGHKIVFEPKAITRHEEPANFQSFVKQRKRWTRGLVRVRKKSLKMSELFSNFVLRGSYFYIAPLGLLLLILFPIFAVFASPLFLLPLFALFLVGLGLVVYARIYFHESLRDLLALPMWFFLQNVHLPLLVNAYIEERSGKKMKWYKVERED